MLYMLSCLSLRTLVFAGRIRIQRNKTIF